MILMSRKILVIAIFSRIIIFLLCARGFFPIGEGRVSADLATNILSGNGYRLSAEMLYSSERPSEDHRAMHDQAFAFFRRVNGFYGCLVPEKPTMFFVPGYPLFMAAIFAFAGIGNFLAVCFVQLLLGLITVLAGIRIASRFLSGKWLAVTSLFIAVHPYELYFEAVPATQAVFTFFMMLAVLFSLRMMEKRKISDTIVAGLLWGCAFYIRPAALPVVGLLVVCAASVEWFSWKSIMKSGLLLLVFTLTLVPWAVRNHGICGKYRIMPTQGGVNLWEYHGQIFSSYFENEMKGAVMLYGPLREQYLQGLNAVESVEFPEFREESEIERDSVMIERSLEFITNNPVLYLHLAFLRTIELFKPFPLNPYPATHNLAGIISFFWVLLFMIPGTIVFLRRRTISRLFIVLTTWGYVLMHILTASGTPHRVPADFLLILLAMIGVKYAAGRLKQHIPPGFLLR